MWLFICLMALFYAKTSCWDSDLRRLRPDSLCICSNKWQKGVRMSKIGRVYPKSVEFTSKRSLGGESMAKEFVMMERKKSVEGLDLTYRLVARLVGERVGEYRVSVKLGETLESASFGNLFEAVKLFSLITEGLVTPCTFQDIVSDLGENAKI